MTVRRTRQTVRLAAATLAAILGSSCGDSERRGAGETAAVVDAPSDARTLHAVTVHRPAGPPRVLLAADGPDGQPLTAACSTCHATRVPDRTNRAADLDQFHQGLQFRHGDSSCFACHDERDYDALKLADGTRLEYADVMTLCSQCHGPQAKDYERGAHGGMTGYWDLRRGPRVRNNCVDCHDPHAPRFPPMVPTFKPKDRFLDPPAPESADAHRSQEGTR